MPKLRGYIAHFENSYQLQWNIILNLIGKGSGAVANLVAIPVYVRLLGREQYGLVGFAISLHAVVALFDFGFGLAINREMAALGSSEDAGSKMRNVLRQVEKIYWGLSILAAASIWVGAGFISQSWLNSPPASLESATGAIRLAAIWILVQFPYSIYHGALSGMGKQLSLNVIQFIFNIARPLLSIAVLMIFGAEISAFLLAQITVSVGQTLLLRLTTWSQVPDSVAKSNSATLPVSKSLSLDSLVIASICWLLLANIDRLILPHYIAIGDYAVYVVVAAIAVLPASLAGPLNVSLLPLLSDAVANLQHAKVAEQIRRSVFLIARWVLPLSILFIAFPHEILWLWTGDRGLADKGGLLLAILSLAFLFYVCQIVPYSLLIASRRTTAFAWQGVCILALTATAIAFTAPHWGAISGAASLAVAYFGMLCSATFSCAAHKFIDARFRTQLWRCVLPVALSIMLLRLIGMLVNVQHKWQAASIIVIAFACAYGPAFLDLFSKRALPARTVNHH